MFKRLVINTGSNLVMTANAMVVTFIMTPIYVVNLGHYDYGIREMLLAFTGYMGMLDIGMRTTVARFVSMYNANDDRTSLLEVYMTSMVFMGLVGLCLALFFWLLALNWPGVIAPDGETTGKYAMFLLLAGIEILFLFPKFVTESYFEGFQYYTLRNGLNIIFTISLATICYNFITPENGLVLLAGLVACQQLLQFIIFSVILARPAYGSIRPHLNSFSMDKLRQMLTFGFKTFVQGVAYQLETASDRLVIGSILGPAVVPVYSVPASLLNNFNGIVYTITHALMPLFSELNARSQHDHIKTIYLYSSKFLLGIIIPGAIAIVVVGGPFIEVWMKGQFSREQVDGIVLLLMLYIIIPRLNPVASRYLTAIGKHGIFARVAPLAAIANLGFSIWLVLQLGVIGAAIGSVIPVVFITPIYLIYTCRNLDVPVMVYVRHVIFPVLIPAWVMLGACVWLRNIWALNSYTEIVGCAIAGGVIYLAAYWTLSISREEKVNIISWLRQRYARS